MKNRIVLLIFIFTFIITAVKTTPINAKDTEVLIKVGLAIGEKEAVFLSDAPMTIAEGNKVILKGRKLQIACINGTAKVNDITFKKKISITPAMGSLIRYNGKPYRGSFEVIPKGNGLTIINLVSIEEYLYGVLKAEISPSWPFEALKAQAVVSRTYALNNIGRHSSQGFDLCAGNHCQGYKGLSSEDPILNKAVDATKGEVLAYNGTLAKVFYHSDSGGCTTSSKYVWGRDIPYLKGRKEEFYASCNSPYKHWKLELPSSKLVEILSENGIEIEDIKDLAITKRDNLSFRALTIRIIGSKRSIEIPATRVRQMIGYSLLRSTAFDILKKKANEKREGKAKPSNLYPPKLSKEERRARARSINIKELLAKGYSYDDIILILAEAYGILERDVAPQNEQPQEEISFEAKDGESIFIFEGRGWGHGVGMSQWGAKTLAEKGKSYTEILQFYFPGTEIKRRW